MATYLAELYLSHAGSLGLRDDALRARGAADELNRQGTPIRYVRAFFVGEDETCFHVYDAGSPESVLEASRLAAIPVERVVEAIGIELDELKEG
jgi:hypothetical protein